MGPGGDLLEFPRQPLLGLKDLSYTTPLSSQHQTLGLHRLDVLLQLLGLPPIQIALVARFLRSDSTYQHLASELRGVGAASSQLPTFLHLLQLEALEADYVLHLAYRPLASLLVIQRTLPLYMCTRFAETSNSFS